MIYGYININISLGVYRIVLLAYILVSNYVIDVVTAPTKGRVSNL